MTSDRSVNSNDYNMRTNCLRTYEEGGKCSFQAHNHVFLGSLPCTSKNPPPSPSPATHVHNYSYNIKHTASVLAVCTLQNVTAFTHSRALSRTLTTSPFWKLISSISDALKEKRAVASMMSRQSGVRHENSFTS